MSVDHLSQFYKSLPPRKICLCVFNRATYGRTKVLIEELGKRENISLTVVLSSSLLWKEFGDAGRAYIRKDSSRVAYELLDIPRAEQSHLGSIKEAAQIADRFGDYFSRHEFDAVVVVADRYETLPAALACAYLNIPLVHIQGGEITGNIDDKVRHSVSMLADYHFVATENAKTYLLALGQERDRIFNTGCPSIDLVRVARARRFRPKERYVLAIFHPETERAEEAFEQTKTVLEATLEYCAKYSAKCYWFYPNPDPGREAITRYLDEAIQAYGPYFVKAVNEEPEDFLRRLAGARYIIGNSSCGIRESSYIGVPAINVGARQRVRERSWNVIDTGYDKDAILKAIEESHVIERHLPSRLYGTGYASREIADYLSRIDFTLKGPLTYPTQFQYREKHFGESRFHDHKKPRTRADNSVKAKLLRSERKRGSVSGEPRGARAADGFPDRSAS
jgi:UDP-hydrolysing UDP-N-acetyl-D-glucosamine 2-epimerase